MRNNQNSATEDTLGFLHSAVTRAFLAKIGMQLDGFDRAKQRYDDAKAQYDLAISEGDEAMAAEHLIDMGTHEIVMAAALDEKTIAAAGKWVRDNEITYATPEDNGETELSRQLHAVKDKQKGKVIQFNDAEEA